MTRREEMPLNPQGAGNPYRQGIDDLQFGRNVRSLFAYQWEYNAPIKRLSGKEITPDAVARWQTFLRHRPLQFKSLSYMWPTRCATATAGRTFHSSGTTQRDKQLENPHTTVVVYRASLRDSYAVCATGW